MSITDELREWLKSLYTPNSATVKDEGERIADRIDAEHEKACAEAYGNGVMSVPIALDESAWVKLPVDADGVPFHIGELVDEMLPFGGYAAPAPIDTMELSRGASGYGWMVKLDAENRASISPKLLRHYHAPTVEDVLREFALAVCKDDALTSRGAGAKPCMITASYSGRWSATSTRADAAGHRACAPTSIWQSSYGTGGRPNDELH